MKKKRLIICAVILAILLGTGFGATNRLSEGANVALSGVDLSGVPDGNYTGVYESGRWSNTVVVYVQGHRITAIDIEKDVFAAFIKNCSNETFRRVLEAQNTTVDAVSGATVTSKAYLKAIEDAVGR
jgi:uncharacterized protein with FMN-binding domain